MTTQSDTIEISGIKKSFGTNTVLHDISLTVSGGEVLALMGANGAGKSTLVKILSGVYDADGGSIAVNGEPCTLDTPQQARDSGIVTVHQIINDGVVQDLTIAENLILDQLCDGRFPAFMSKSVLHERAREVAATIGIDLPLDTQVADLSQADKQLVAIARALSVKPRLLILDEPTSSLSEREALRLFEAVEHMRDQGVAIMYISHRMSDIRRLADRIAALREGRIVGLFEKPLDYDGAVHSMLGHAVGEVMHAYKAGDQARMVFDQVKLADDSRAFDLELKTGQIVALTGLLSSGCATVVECLFGMQAFAGGRVTLDGTDWRVKSPREAIDAGVYMVQEDRGNNAIIPDFSIENNTSLPFLKSFSWFSFINRQQEKARVKEAIDLTRVKYTDPTHEMMTLSGGNQQKVMVARWMLESCRVLLLNEPFQGVDISSRRQIGKLLRETARDRVTIAVCTDVEEALEIADRVIVFNHNNLVGDHRIDQIDMATLIKQIAAAPDADLPSPSSAPAQATELHA